MVVVGDLVYLDNENYLGIVVRLFYETKIAPPLTNALVLWCYNNRKEWCLSEALTVLN
jgi:hypothetical protein